MKTLFLMLFGTMSFVLLSVPATAHPRLLASSPVAGGTVIAPATIKLKFSERLIAAFSGLSIMPLAGGNGNRNAVRVLQTSVDPGGRTMVAQLAAPLRAGRYAVAWHVVSVDTHRVTGRLVFTAR
ncbi:MAG: copper homeostasis periplasmic binding protein CopC [Sandarakinorhabdus sp.]|nr:copper homeostasis periplasmic binding protein CopC [Sandarakinorhabdus sp.]